MSENIPDSLKQAVLGQFDGAILAQVPQGEKAKSFEVYSSLLAKLLENGFSRKDLVIALGGGVVGDLAGFVAATYKRGCRFVSIPTTTLSQIDSSIGGKVAINLNGIKNCVGSFYHPEIVFVDTETLRTLEKRHFYNGLVEALKAGDLVELGQLLNQSHYSLRDLYEVTGKELDTLSALARKESDCLGSRMIGGGFGGCTQ